MDIFANISNSLISGNDKEVFKFTTEAINLGLPTEEILDKGLIAGMNVIGDRFRDHEIFLPDVLMSAKSMYAGMDLLKPLLIKENIPVKGKIVMGTIQGDLHDIGKNLVVIMLKGAGYEVIDLGNDVPVRKFVDVARSENASVIGMSALLTTTMKSMKDVVQLLEKENLKGKIKTVVGGAPSSKEFADNIGADGYGFDAGNAVEIINDLIN